MHDRFSCSSRSPDYQNCAESNVLSRQLKGTDEVRIRLPSISLIVARSWPDSIIGRNNKLPWHLRTDLRRFKSITLGFPIIMGRKTYLSIGHPLPGRTNIVMSRTPESDLTNSFWQHEETMLLWVANRESALFFSDVKAIAQGKSDVFVIGGAEMYGIFDDLFNKIYLTEVITGDKLVRVPGDAIFELKFDHRHWNATETVTVPTGPNDEFPSRFTVLERKYKTVRYIEVKNYYTEKEARNKWLGEQMRFVNHLKTTSKLQPFEIPYEFKFY